MTTAIVQGWNPRTGEPAGEPVPDTSLEELETVLTAAAAAAAEMRRRSSAEIRATWLRGSLAGGRALFDIACRRAQPIPFYGELGSLNPVVVTEAAVRCRGREIVDGCPAGIKELIADRFSASRAARVGR
jgi:acyl-CoA reductase-like NAD-dependent aldehyde dehydrogenase